MSRYLPPLREINDEKRMHQYNFNLQIVLPIRAFSGRYQLFGRPDPHRLLTKVFAVCKVAWKALKITKGQTNIITITKKGGVCAPASCSSNSKESCALRTIASPKRAAKEALWQQHSWVTAATDPRQAFSQFVPGKGGGRG